MNIASMAAVYSAMYQNTAKVRNTATDKTSFSQQIQNVSSAAKTETEAYTEYLKSKYGNVMIMNVGKDQNSMDNLGMGTAGYGNVVIAPNILEQMANDPEKAAYYEEKIQHHFDTIPETEAFMAAIGHVTTSAGVVIHEDGSVTYYLSGEESPEKKAKFEAAQKEKREKKAEKQRENLERSKEIAEERRQELESHYRDHLMEQMQNGQRFDFAVAFSIAGQSQAVAPSVSAYERAISTISSSVIQGI